MAAKKLPPPPKPIAKGLHAFAERYGSLICPGFVIDEIADVMLRALEEWVEGKTQRLLLNPPPRSSKTVCAVLALAYSLLRFPLRAQILLSANQRLAVISNTMLKDVVVAALPDGYELSADTKSKLGWKIGCQGAGIQIALSRGASLLGYTGHRILADDLLGQVNEADKPDLMQTVMRTLQVDVMTRLTKDPYGQEPGLAITAQRLGPNDPTGQLIAKERIAESEGLRTTPFTVVACPFLAPTMERKGEIVGSYPNDWRVLQPAYGEPGTPVSSRFTPEFAANLKAQLPPQDWAALYELDVTQDAGWCAWKESYISLIPADEVDIEGTFIAIDMSLTGGDDSALVAAGVQDGRVIIVGLHILPSDVDQALPAIVALAERYGCHTLGIEKAAAGHQVLKSLNNTIGGRTWRVVPLSHEGRNKKARQAKILGLGANHKIWAVEGLELLPVLQAQMKSVALGKKKAKDDLADAAVYAISWINDRWIKSGFIPTSATWSCGADGQAGVAPVIWGRGTHTHLKPRLGIDGVERYSIGGFS